MLETNKKIMELTKEQKDSMHLFAKKYIEKGLSTEPSNKKLAEHSITEIYKLIDRKKPKFIWVGSPFSANVVINVLKRLKFKNSAVRSAVYSAVDSAVSSAVSSAVDSAVRSADSKLDFNSNYFGGNLWSAWVSFYKFFEESKLVKYNEFDSMRLNLFSDIVDSCGWWYPFENICIVCDRPEIINIEDGQLHRENMPAVKFRDGWSIYAINGHLVPEKVIMTPELITLEEIEKEVNSETKRIMIDRYGIGKYLAEIGAKVIDIDSSNTFRSLIVTKDNRKFLEGTDGSTERVYFMPVPSYVQTCKEAHESICGVDEDIFLMQS